MNLKGLRERNVYKKYFSALDLISANKCHYPNLDEHINEINLYSKLNNNMSKQTKEGISLIINSYKNPDTKELTESLINKYEVLSYEEILDDIKYLYNIEKGLER